LLTRFFTLAQVFSFEEAAQLVADSLEAAQPEVAPAGMLHPDAVLNAFKDENRLFVVCFRHSG
jgi:hypothetical protein